MTVRERVTHWSYDSRLHPNTDADDCRMLELIVRMQVTFLDRGQRARSSYFREASTSQADWNDTMKTNFKNAARRHIHEVWRDKLWLCYEGAPSPDGEKKDIKCGVTVQDVGDSTTPALQGGPQLRVQAIITDLPIGECIVGGAATARGNPRCYQCQQEGRSENESRNCRNPGHNWLLGNSLRHFNRPLSGLSRAATDRDFDMVMAANTDGRPFTARQKYDPDDAEEIPQRAIAHEFGHYLGLDHACMRAWLWFPSSNRPNTARMPRVRSAATSPRQYCIGVSREQAQNIMAIGERVAPLNGFPWLHRIEQGRDAGGERVHHYFPGTTWLATTNLQATRRSVGRRNSQVTPPSGTAVSPG